MRRFLGLAITAALVFTLAAAVFAPLVVFFGVRSAADAGDVQALTRLIDFSAVRTSLRPQMGTAPVPAPPPSILHDPIGAIRRSFEDMAPERRIDPDVYLTPTALAALTRGAGRTATAPSGSLSDAWPRPIYWSVNSARLAVGKGADRTVFSFRRKGPFEWVMVHIGLPPAPPTAASASPAR